MNVKPKNYEWIEFYDLLIDLYRHSCSTKTLLHRISANPNLKSKGINFIRTVSWEGHGRIKYFLKIRKKLIEDKYFRDYFEGNGNTLPGLFVDMIKKDLGHMWYWLPEGAIYHDHKAYLKKSRNSSGLKKVGS